MCEMMWCFAVAAMQLVLVFLNFTRVSEVTLGAFLGILCYEIWWCFAVADASESHAARAYLSQFQYGFRSNVRPLCGVPVLRFGA